MESWISTENHSVVSKNLSNSDRGLWAEQIVCDFLIQKKWSIISKRTKYKFGEIDLIAERDRQVAIVEIKFLHQHWMAFERLQLAQLSRLQKNYIYLSQTCFYKKNTKLFLCFVSRDQKITWVNLTD